LNVSAGRKVSRKPPKKLGKFPRSVVGTDGFGNTTPNVFGSRTQEKEM
jgi:hypothetical protein